MAKPHRFLWDHLGSTSPADADRENASPPAVTLGAQREGETAAERNGARVSENVEQEPGRPEGLGPDAVTVPSWRERFASPEELFEAFRNEQTRRGRLANELGEVRAENRELQEHVAAFQALVFVEIELQKRALGAGGQRIPASGLEGLLRHAGKGSNGSSEAHDTEVDPALSLAGGETPEPVSGG
jgi:hypothetical protein